MITKKQFSVLETLALTKDRLSQRSIASSLSMSIGNANRIIGELDDIGFIKDGMITEKPFYIYSDNTHKHFSSGMNAVYERFSCGSSRLVNNND